MTKGKKIDYKFKNVKNYAREIFKSNWQKEHQGKQSYERESKKIHVHVGI